MAESGVRIEGTWEKNVMNGLLLTYQEKENLSKFGTTDFVFPWLIKVRAVVIGPSVI